MSVYIPPGKKTGLIPRDYKSHPVGSYEGVPEYPDELLIPENEWDELQAEQQAAKASLLDLRETYYDTLKSMDQNGYGLCWFFSTTKAVMYLRALMNLPPVRLSAWYGAGIINGWRDQGGWGAASLDFFIKNGTCSEDFCPKYSRSAVKQGAEENAALHKVTEWYDGSDDPDKAFAQFVSNNLRGIPGVCDYNSLSHSMCGVGFKRNPRTIINDNSWNEINDFGPKGLYYCTGRNANINGLVFPRVAMATTT